MPVHPVEERGDLFGELFEAAVVILHVGDVPGLEDQGLQVGAEDDLAGSRRQVADHEVERQALVVGKIARNVLGRKAGDDDRAGEEVGMTQRHVPGHVSPGELTGDEDPVAVDRVPPARIANRQLDRGVLAGCIPVVGRLARHVVLRRDHDVTSPGRLSRPDLDSRLRPLPGVQRDDRGIGTKRVVLGRQANGVFRGLLVLLLQQLVGHGFLRLLGGVAEGRRHELGHPGDEVELPEALGDALLGGPLESFELGQNVLAPRGLCSGQVIVHQLARLPQGVGHAQLGDRGVAAHHVSRHRQGELAKVAGAGARTSLAPGEKTIADGVGRLFDGLHGLGDSFLPDPTLCRGQFSFELAEVGGQGKIVGPLLVVAADHIADLEQELGGDLFLRETPEHRRRLAVLLGLAANLDLGAALGGLGLDDVPLRPGGSLTQVRLRKIMNDPVELLPGLWIVACIHQEADNSFALGLVLLLDAGQQAGHHRPGDLGGRHLAEPEPIHAAILDHVGTNLDDGLLHGGRPGRLRADVAERSSPLLVPRAGLDAEHFLGHRPGVHHQRLNERELLASPVRVITDDPLDLRVADHGLLQAVPDVNQGGVLVGCSLAQVDHSVFQRDRITPGRGSHAQEPGK